MFERFSTRSRELERLDTGDYTPQEYAKWQQEMRIIHRVFGELRALKNTLIRDVLAGGESEVSILDVGAGSGELLRLAGKELNEKKAFLAGAELNADAAKSIHDKGLASLRTDAMKLPFADDAFDYVFCSLFLHHLDDEPAIRMLREMNRVAGKRIFVVDLNRSPVAYYFYKIVGSLFLQRFTVEDGSLSILRSRPPKELLEIAEKAGLKDANIEHSKANRLILSGRK